MTDLFGSAQIYLGMMMMIREQSSCSCRSFGRNASRSRSVWSAGQLELRASGPTVPITADCQWRRGVYNFICITFHVSKLSYKLRLTLPKLPWPNGLRSSLEILFVLSQIQIPDGCLRVKNFDRPPDTAWAFSSDLYLWKISLYS